jgi:tetratricopeptide (TPR) repeat protein
MSRSDLPAEVALLQPLDGGEGPALRLSSTERRAVVEAALERALPARRPRFAAVQRWSRVASTAPSTSVSGASPSAGSRTTSGLTEPRPIIPVPDATAEVASVGEGASPASSAKTDSVTERASNPRTGGAADLLKLANQLRRQGQWAEAERAYARVASNYGGSTQGPVAALAAASLRLEHLSDPRGALRLYQSAKKAPSLAAEAEFGVANCYRALGDREAEMVALRRVTSAYPEALFHDRAARRLQALEGRKP